jgi:membrane protein YqaA with SNARE-associated domain
VITIYLATIGYAFVSAFVPFTPVEPYLLGVVAATDDVPLLLGLSAAAGQTAGKVLLFLAARGTIRWNRLREWLARKTDAATAKSPRRKWLAEQVTKLTDLLDRPTLTAPIVLLSAVVGIPPLLLVTVYAARTRISLPVFAIVCLLGRAARFITLVYVPHWFGF